MTTSNGLAFNHPIMIFNNADTSVKRIFFVGIKGIAMAALAVLAKEAGYTVAGSDTAEIFPSDAELAERSVHVSAGFDPDTLTAFRPDAVIFTGAHGGRDNPQVKAALSVGIPCYPHGQALGMFMSGKRSVSVAGSHGKTTTSSLISMICTKAGLDPSYAIGCGSITGLGAAGHWGQGLWFIAEADEYMTDPGHDPTPRFHWQAPEILVVTNIDYDHPDAYPDITSIKRAFSALAAKVPADGAIYYDGDDPESAFLSGNRQSVPVGFGKSNAVRIESVVFSAQETAFRLNTADRPFSIKIPGRHNVINASLAACAARQAGCPDSAIEAGLKAFAGAKRRFEKIAGNNGILFYDDYAHHPAEISATLDGARLRFPDRRLVCVFQPHTFSRTRSLLTEFSHAFRQADITVITAIYASAREKTATDITGKILSDKIAPHTRQSYYADGKEDVIRLLRRVLKTGDLVIFMGAGDIYNWEKEVTDKI